MAFDISTSDNVKHLFQSSCIMDVTLFDEQTDGSIGYMCGGELYLVSDGSLIFQNSEKKIQFSLNDILAYKKNINNYDPRFVDQVSFILPDAEYRFIFDNTQEKNMFINALVSLKSDNGKQN